MKHNLARCHRLRKGLGGGMRQAGLMAAGAIYALENHVQRLTVDHDNARKIADALRGAPKGLTVDYDPACCTNLVFFTMDKGCGVSAQEMSNRLKEVWEEDLYLT